MKYKVTKKKNHLKEDEVKFYPQPVKLGVKKTYDLAMEIAGRCSLTRGDVLNVLSNLNEVINKWLIAGYHVKINDLGTLRITFRSEGTLDAKKCDSTLIKHPRVRFFSDKNLKEEVEKNISYESVATIKV